MLLRPQPLSGRFVRRFLEDGAKVGGRRWPQLDLSLEVGARHRVQGDGKLPRRDPRQPRGQVVDGVVLDGPRAVAARVGRLEREVLVDLLAGLDLQGDGLPGVVELAAGPLVESESGAQRLGVVLEQPFDAVERIRRLFAAGHRELDVAPRLESFLLIADQAVGEDRRHRLVVAGAARVEPPVFLDQLEGIAHPVLALRLDDIEVREKKDGAGLGIASAQRGDEVAVLRSIGRNENPDVARRQPRRLEPRPHRFRGGGATARGEGCVDLDQFLVQLTERRFPRPGRRRLPDKER
jgi:hypothetical protein